MQNSRVKDTMKETYGEFFLNVDHTFSIRRVSEGYSRITGYGKEEVLEGKHTLEQLIDPEDYQEVCSQIVRVLSIGETQVIKHRICTRDGVFKSVLNVLSLHREADRLKSVRCILIDDMVGKENEVCPADQRIDQYFALADAEQEIYFEYDMKKDTLTFPNRKNETGECEQIFHFSDNIIRLDTIHPADRSRFSHSWSSLNLVDGIQSVEFRTRRFSKDYEWFRLIGLVVPDENGIERQIVGRLRNIEKEKAVEKELLEKSTRDSLTGLLNEPMMMALTDQFFNNQQEESSHALFLIDIENMKLVNQKMGYTFGDTVLESIAESLQKIFPSDSFIGRKEGTKFAVLVKDTHSIEVEILAGQVCRTIRSSFVGEDEELHVHAKIGVAVYPFHGLDYKKLVHRAGLALHEIKKHSQDKGWKLYSEEDDTDSVAEHSLAEEDEKKAMQRKTGVYDSELIASVFDTFSSASDTMNALWLVLDRIGMKYDLGRILFLDGRNSHHVLFPTFEWNRQEQLGREELKNRGTYNYEFWKQFVDSGEMFGIHTVDCMNHITMPEQREIIERLHVKSLICCSTYLNNDLSGCIIFMDDNKERTWNSIEKETFYQLSKILAYFLRTKSKDDMTQKRIEKLTHYDRVTGLYNMDRFKEEAVRIIRERGDSGFLAIAYCDLSNFAFINESYGYERGDDLLYSFARIMVHENPICQIGGRVFSDCFALLLSCENKNQLMDVIQDTVERFEREQKHRFPNADIHVVTGVCIWDGSEPVTVAIDNANLARKSIKGNRKAVCQFYKSEMKDVGKKEFIAMATLQEAMDLHHLNVYLQPKISLQGEQLVGAEALIRWINPDGTFKYPDDFVPVLERTGSIVDLDFYVYEQVLIQMVQWQMEGRHLVPVSVNLSRMHGYYSDFAERILELTAKYNVPSHLIEFEVTESAFVNAENMLMSKLEVLRNAGFHISMDDFGVGYSSLGMLLDAPIDCVKIDKSFLNRYEVEQNRRSLIRYIIEMAHTLDKAIVFEGVENRDQAAFLKECGCETVQGFLFSRPIPMKEFCDNYLN